MKLSIGHRRDSLNLGDSCGAASGVFFEVGRLPCTHWLEGRRWQNGSYDYGAFGEHGNNGHFLFGFQYVCHIVSLSF